MKKFITIVCTLVVMLAIAAPVMAAPKVPEPPPEVGARYAINFLNVGFHCGKNGGNGRVWVDAYDELYNNAKKAKLKGVLADFQYLGDNCWMLCDTASYVCPKCGSSVWVSYSNKSGVPDGLNMQLTHSAVPEEIPETYATFSISVQKHLTDSATGVCKALSMNPKFNFTLKLTVNGAPVPVTVLDENGNVIDVSVKSIAVNDIAYWHVDLKDYFPAKAKSITVSWTITEEETGGFESVTKIITGSMTVKDGADAAANGGVPYEWVNDLQYKR